MILTWRDVSIDGGPSISTSLTAAEAQAIEENARGKIVLEIGSAYGYSSIIMGRVAEHVFAIDPHAGYGSLPDSLNRMRINVAAYGVEDSVSIVVGNSGTVLDFLYEAGASFDLVFIDGDHRDGAVKKDSDLARMLLREGGTILWHDYGEESCPGVRKVIDRDEDFSTGRLIADTLWCWER